MQPEIDVEFRITGTQIEPDRITEFFGISPTRVWLVGESIQGTKLKRKCNGWCLSAISPEKPQDLADTILALLVVLLPKSKLISQICNKYNLESELSCAIYISDQTPAINFTQDIISGLAELNTSIDIDIILIGGPL